MLVLSISILVSVLAQCKVLSYNDSLLASAERPWPDHLTNGLSLLYRDKTKQKLKTQVGSGKMT